MRAAIVVVGLLAALLATVLALFTIGLVPAIVVTVLVVGAVVTGFFLPENALRGLLSLMVLVVVVSLGIAGWGVWSIARALGTTDGDVDPPDAAALASIDAKFDAAADDQGFRIEFSTAELNAAVQEALGEEGSHPIRAIEFFVAEPDLAPNRGVLGFEASFKSGGITASGELQVEIEAGKPVLEVRDLDLGMFSLPGVAEGAASDMVDAIADFNEALGDLDGELQDLRIYSDRVVALGIQRGAEITPDQVLDRVRSGFGSLELPYSLPDQIYEAGTDSTSVDGSSYYVALGDSLAANVGVGRQGRGYVGKFHRYISERDTVDYGLRNFGISGETSSSIFETQLPEALEFIASNEIAYVTIDIGANDFLGHLSSGECSIDIESPPCLERLDATYIAYRINIREILTEIANAAPDATLVFLTAYNPFSFGFPDEIAFERASTEVTIRFNSIAAATATELGFLVADGEAALIAKAIPATHMGDSDPDIHPNAAGYDFLTGALVEAVGG